MSSRVDILRYKHASSENMKKGTSHSDVHCQSRIFINDEENDCQCIY